ncbi:hypothetical protein ACFP3Q_02905 [Nocardioides sp. GCM10027113]|uniref:hypothetical protein n=1 Tax=unclassified Nocardioides TaxID=2615069 RepID=UPI00360F16CA
MTGPTPKRTPSDRNPEPDRREMDMVVNTASAAAGAGTGTWGMGPLFRFLSGRKRHKLERRLAAEHAAQRDAKRAGSDDA